MKSAVRLQSDCSQCGAAFKTAVFKEGNEFFLHLPEGQRISVILAQVYTLMFLFPA